MEWLVRHPFRLLAAHWALTLFLAAVLLAPRQSAPSAAGGVISITLITGQVLHLRDGLPEPDAGLTEGQLFGTDTYALPAGMPATAIGARFDPLLFDVSYLAANGFDDRSRETIPVIVRFSTITQARQAVRQGSAAGPIHFTHAFEYVPDAAGYVSKRGPFVPLAAHDGIQAIYLDAVLRAAPDPISAGDIRPTLNEALPLIGIDAARKRGLTGRNIAIAILDSGVDASHPDLRGRVIAARNFSDDGDQIDHAGHGTHVAGIAAGTGAASDGKYGGVAPAARLIDAKALDRRGEGSASAVMEAMEWAADQGARIENMSLGGTPSDGKDPVSQDVNAITAQKGVLFVVGAGNNGPRGRVLAPAAADLAMAVVAVDKQRRLAPFSARGPRTGDNAVKPDLAAPGVQITAPRANRGAGDPYVTYSGTGMAAPMAAGAAALAMQMHPDWSPLQVRDALLSSAGDLGGDGRYISVYEQGTGLLNLGNFVDQKVLIDPATVSFGIIGEDDVAVKTVRIRNLTDHPFTIDVQWHIHLVEGSGALWTRTVTPHFTLPPSGRVKITFIVGCGAAPGVFSSEILAMRDGQPLARAAAGFTCG